MSKKAAEHHKKASEHHSHAARTGERTFIFATRSQRGLSENQTNRPDGRWG
jgi:hypothetical protein